MHAAQHVFRSCGQQGNLINTVTIAEHTSSQGIRHIARYVLMREAGRE